MYGTTEIQCCKYLVIMLYYYVVFCFGQHVVPQELGAKFMLVQANQVHYVHDVCLLYLSGVYATNCCLTSNSHLSSVLHSDKAHNVKWGRP